MGQFPPLAGSDWVLGDKDRLIKISMYGLMGEIEVNGIKYTNVMAPPGIPPGSLTDEQPQMCLPTFAMTGAIQHLQFLRKK